MRTRLVATLAATLLLSGCMFPQGWHWPRTDGDTTQTHIYIQNELADYQVPYMAWAAGYYNGHPELAMHLVDTCPAGVNCIVARTLDISPNAGLTSVGCCSDGNHIGSSLLRLHPVLGQAGTDEVTNRKVVFHELCHALGGGFTPPDADSIHEFCNWEHRSAIFAEIADVYHDD